MLYVWHNLYLATIQHHSLLLYSKFVYLHHVTLLGCRIALLQLATREVIYLLDVITLTTRITKDILQNFMAAVFSSPDTIKLGSYSYAVCHVHS